jgi:hypothetical protein
MYCKKCGKYIDYEADVCNECKEAENAQEEVKDENAYNPFEETVAPAPADAGNRMYGFGKALASNIIGFFNMFLMAFGIALAAVYPPLGIVILLASVAGFVISLIFAIKSIKAFVKRCREKCAKPIATLVLGISGLEAVFAQTIYFIVGMAAFLTWYFA